MQPSDGPGSHELAHPLEHVWAQQVEALDLGAVLRTNVHRLHDLEALLLDCSREACASREELEECACAPRHTADNGHVDVHCLGGSVAHGHRASPVHPGLALLAAEVLPDLLGPELCLSRALLVVAGLASGRLDAEPLRLILLLVRCGGRAVLRRCRLEAIRHVHVHVGRPEPDDSDAWWVPASPGPRSHECHRLPAPCRQAVATPPASAGMPPPDAVASRTRTHARGQAGTHRCSAPRPGSTRSTFVCRPQ